MKTRNENTSPFGELNGRKLVQNSKLSSNPKVVLEFSEKEKIPSVNFHLWEPCNMRCKFCFATFQDVKHSILPKGHIPKDQALAVVRELASMGFQKITFAGGEPTLCPWLPRLIETAKKLGMTTMIVTNGSGLTKKFLKENKKYLDWIALSIDSLNEQTNLKSGRAISGKRAFSESKYRELILSIKELGFGFKINTVVHRHNFQEDFKAFIQWANPGRWKVLQVLPMEGQNDEGIEDLEVSDAEFKFFQFRHEEVKAITQVVFEDVDAIRGTYVMVDPAGRFFDNAEGKHRYSLPILNVGGNAAFQQMQYDFEGFMNRGGVYDWNRKLLPSRITLSGKVASGKSTIGRLLAERLGYEFVSLGNQVRKEAEKMGMSIGEFQNHCLSHPGKDQEIDAAFSSSCNEKSQLVIDYRLGFEFIKEGFHVYLDIDDDMALERLQNAARPGDNADTLKSRNETFRRQFQQAYGIDYTEKTHYNLVIDCSVNKSVQEIVDQIIQALQA